MFRYGTVGTIPARRKVRAGAIRVRGVPGAPWRSGRNRRSAADRDRASRARRRRAAPGRPRCRPAAARSCSRRRRFQLVLGVVRELPRQPVGGPLRVRRFDPLGRKRKRAAGRAIERGELRRETAAARPSPSAARRGRRAGPAASPRAPARTASAAWPRDRAARRPARAPRAARRRPAIAAHAMAAATINADEQDHVAAKPRLASTAATRAPARPPAWRGRSARRARSGTPARARCRRSS